MAKDKKGEPQAGRQTPTRGRVVTYTNSSGADFAAVICRATDTDRDQVNLVYFDDLSKNDNGGFGNVRFEHEVLRGDGFNNWRWPEYVAPKADKTDDGGLV